MTASHIETLPAELQAMEQLVALLRQEQQHLIGVQTDQLTAVTPQKQQLVNQLNLYATARNKALAQAGLTADDAGMQAALAAHGNPESGALWARLLELTAHAKELNRVSGMLISRQLTYTQEALAALQGKTAHQAGEVYGPSGQKAAGFGKRGGGYA